MTEGALRKIRLQILNRLCRCCQRPSFLIWLVISEQKRSDCKSGAAAGDGVCSPHKISLIKSGNRQKAKFHLNYGLRMNLIHRGATDELYSSLMEEVRVRRTLSVAVELEVWES